MKTVISLVTFLISFSRFSYSQVKENPRVIIRTEMGDIVVEVYEDRAPVTAGNFLSRREPHANAKKNANMREYSIYTLNCFVSSYYTTV